MNTRWLVVALVLMFVAGTFAGSLTQMTPRKAQSFKPLGDDCDVCIGFINTDIQILVQAIVEVGIEDGCSELCNFIPNGLEADICTLYCEVQGINAFTAILQQLNPDPIAVCMAMKVCPSNAYARGAIKALTVSPSKGVQGTTFNIDLTYVITNTTGTGQVLIQVTPPGSNSNAFGAAAPIQAQRPGEYRYSLQVQSQPNQDQPFNPGLYQVVTAVCEGTCGGISKWAYIIAEAGTKFSITSN